MSKSSIQVIQHKTNKTRTTQQILVQFRKSGKKFDRDEETEKQDHVHGGVGGNLRVVGVVVLHGNG